LDHFLHHTLKLGIPVEMVQFLLKLLLKQRFLAVHHDFHCFKTNFITFMLRSLSRKFWKGRSRSRKFWKGRRRSRIFYLRLRNPEENCDAPTQWSLRHPTLHETFRKS